MIMDRCKMLGEISPRWHRGIHEAQHVLLYLEGAHLGVTPTAGLGWILPVRWREKHPVNV